MTSVELPKETIANESLRDINIEKFNVNNIPARLDVLNAQLNESFKKVAVIITEKNHLEAILGLVEALNASEKIRTQSSNL